MKTEFTFERATKNTYRFQEVVTAAGDEPVIGTLYIKKSAFPGKQPERLTVTVEEG